MTVARVPFPDNAPPPENPYGWYTSGTICMGNNGIVEFSGDGVYCFFSEAGAGAWKRMVDPDIVSQDKETRDRCRQSYGYTSVTELKAEDVGLPDCYGKLGDLRQYDAELARELAIVAQKVVNCWEPLSYLELAVKEFKETLEAAAEVESNDAIR